jgi:cystathionine beta-synthase
MLHGAKANVLEAIGNTPIVKLNHVASHIDSEIYVKLEYMNPGGSIKERIGAYILEQAVQDGLLKPGGTIIEGTSGNTGVGLAMFAAVHGYKCVFVLADKQSREKINNLRAFGARVVICPTNVEPEDPRSYYSVAKRLSETIPNSYYVNQYENNWNRDTHYKFTGPEIYEQTKGEFDAFVATAGTGGTITGVSKYLKEKKPAITTVGVDCEGSILAHFAETGEMKQAHTYVLEGIGEDFIPGNYDFDVIDKWEVIGDKESFIMTRKLLSKEGIYTGGSGGGAVVGAIKYAEKLDKPQKILVILPDSGNRYTSKIFNDDWMSDNGYTTPTFNVTLEELISSIGKDREQLVTIKDDATVGEAIELMNEKALSQLPVSSKGSISGVVTERMLLKPILDGDITPSDPVTLAYDDKFKIVDCGELLSNVSETLVNNKDILLVTKKDQAMTILTNIDILRFISDKQSF